MVQSSQSLPPALLMALSQQASQSSAPSGASLASPLPAPLPFSPSGSSASQGGSFADQSPGGLPGLSSATAATGMSGKPALLRKWWGLKGDAQNSVTLSQIVSNPFTSGAITGAVIGASSGLITLAFVAAKKGTAAIKEQLKPIALMTAGAAVVSGVIEFIAARATNKKYGELLLTPEVGPMATVAEANRYLQQNQSVWPGQSSAGTSSMGASSQPPMASQSQPPTPPELAQMPTAPVS